MWFYHSLTYQGAVLLVRLKHFLFFSWFSWELAEIEPLILGNSFSAYCYKFQVLTTFQIFLWEIDSSKSVALISHALMQYPSCLIIEKLPCYSYIQIHLWLIPFDIRDIWKIYDCIQFLIWIHVCVFLLLGELCLKWLQDILEYDTTVVLKLYKVQMVVWSLLNGSQLMVHYQLLLVAKCNTDKCKNCEKR